MSSVNFSFISLPNLYWGYVSCWKRDDQEARTYMRLKFNRKGFASSSRSGYLSQWIDNICSSIADIDGSIMSVRPKYDSSHTNGAKGIIGFTVEIWDKQKETPDVVVIIASAWLEVIEKVKERRNNGTDTFLQKGYSGYRMATIQLVSEEI